MEILKDTINTMIGERADVELTKNIKKKIYSFPDVHGVYDLVLHSYGQSEIMGCVHIEVDDDMSAKEIHRLTKRIQIVLYQEFGIVFTIGIYASNNDKEEYLEIKNEIAKIVSSYEDIIQFHGFYVDEDMKVITFDLIFKFECKNVTGIRNQIIKNLEEIYPNYHFYIDIDTDFSE